MLDYEELDQDQLQELRELAIQKRKEEEAAMEKKKKKKFKMKGATKKLKNLKVK